MISARRRALILFMVAAVGLGAFALSALHREPAPLPARAEAERPTLLLLTSLPLLFNEGFSLQGGGSPALKSLLARYRIVPISVTDAAELRKGRLLLMAQPPAQTAENLVALDAWVRSGGRVLLLADPMLEWPSERPLGDPLRPAPIFMDTGLLAHWGLRLDAPEERGPAERALGGFQVRTISPGRLEGRCEIAAEALAAHCRIGKGEATIVADADFLDSATLGKGGERNLDALVAELFRLETGN